MIGTRSFRCTNRIRCTTRSGRRAIRCTGPLPPGPPDEGQLAGSENTEQVDGAAEEAEEHAEQDEQRLGANLLVQPEAAPRKQGDDGGKGETCAEPAY